ncbi:hypothetical protein D9M71_408250 [compost metagenome]
MSKDLAVLIVEQAATEFRRQFKEELERELREAIEPEIRRIARDIAARVHGQVDLFVSRPGEPPVLRQRIEVRDA